MRRMNAIPLNLPDQPIGRYGKGTLDLIVDDGKRVWACLVQNSVGCPQEFYFWNGESWVDKSIPTESGGGASRVRVPYKTLMRLYEETKR